MKAALLILLAALASAQTTLDSRASDPVKMGWMVGTPPPSDKTIRAADGSYFEFPKTRWAFSNYQQLFPTRLVARGTTISVLPRAERSDIDSVKFQTMTWAQSLDANYTDGILILHKGQIVYERYFGVLKPAGAHIAFSVTKSFVATIAASLIVVPIIHQINKKHTPHADPISVTDLNLRPCPSSAGSRNPAERNHTCRARQSWQRHTSPPAALRIRSTPFLR